MNAAQTALGWLTGLLIFVGGVAVVTLSVRNESIWAGVVLAAVGVFGYMAILGMILWDSRGRGNPPAPG